MDLLINQEETKILNSMMEVIKKSDAIYHPSLFWERLSKINFEQLKREGYANFKRTINQNYFNFCINNWRAEPFKSVFLKWLKKPNLEIFRAKYNGKKVVERAETNPMFALRERHLLSFFYKLFVSMLWEYAKTIDRENLLEKLEEPQEGNPIRIFYKRRLISQDLANSVLEYYAITDNIPREWKEDLTVAELGGGYGRTAFVFLKTLKCKYVLFDIPPALYICQRYLGSIFPELKIFKFRDFRKYSEIKSEYENADICFFTPNQMELLPKSQFNLFITISTLGEMAPGQIKHYFDLINQCCDGYLYTKQQLIWKNPYDNLTVSYKDYPVPSTWKLIFFQKHPIQKDFFEALYKI